MKKIKINLSTTKYEFEEKGDKARNYKVGHYFKLIIKPLQTMSPKNP